LIEVRYEAFFYRIGNYNFLYDGGCKGEKPPADKGRCFRMRSKNEGYLFKALAKKMRRETRFLFVYFLTMM